MKNAETLVKSGKYIEAYKEANSALQLDPNNKKYKQKLTEIGRAASKEAESDAREKTAADPRASRDLLQEALRYDPLNSSAAQALKDLETRIAEASKKALLVRNYLDEGRLSEAQSTLDTIKTYRTFVGSIDSLESAASSETHLNRAEQLWKSGSVDGVPQELAEAEGSLTVPLYVKTKSPELRREISAHYFAKASNTPVTGLGELIQQAKALNTAIAVDPGNKDALSLIGSMADSLSRMLPAGNSPGIYHGRPSSASRVRLQEVEMLGNELKGDSSLSKWKSDLTSQAYPLLHVRLVVGEPNGCESLFDGKTLAKVMETAVSPVAVVDNQFADAQITIANIHCSRTDIPIQSEQGVNSTYVAGQSQQDNPDYVQLLVAAQQAENDVRKFEYDNQINPNFGTALALGMARGRLNRLRTQLSRTAPYVHKNVYQQYQYRKFAAYRSFEISSSVSISSARNSKRIFGEEPLRVLAERHADGVSGVLPQDDTGAKDIVPKIDQFEQIESESKDELVHLCFSKSRELVAKLIASDSRAANLAGMEKLGLLLYAADLSKGTSLQPEYQEAMPIFHSTLMFGAGHLGSFEVPPNISTLAEIEIEGNANDVSESKAPSIESLLDGVVEIETDFGIGSGFFITPSCQIVTNFHVVGRSETIVVKTSAKKLLVAQMVDHDANRDLALLTVGMHGCHYLQLGDPSFEKIGLEVYAIGNPLGLENSVTKGIISAQRTAKDGIRYLQIDATINPGNSGGPLISKSGFVIGVNTFKVRGFEGLNFAISASEIKEAFRKYIH